MIHKRDENFTRRLFERKTAHQISSVYWKEGDDEDVAEVGEIDDIFYIQMLQS